MIVGFRQQPRRLKSNVLRASQQARLGSSRFLRKSAAGKARDRQCAGESSASDVYLMHMQASSVRAYPTNRSGLRRGQVAFVSARSAVRCRSFNAISGQCIGIRTTRSADIHDAGNTARDSRCCARKHRTPIAAIAEIGRPCAVHPAPITATIVASGYARRSPGNGRRNQTMPRGSAFFRSRNKPATARIAEQFEACRRGSAARSTPMVCPSASRTSAEL